MTADEMLRGSLDEPADRLLNAIGERASEIGSRPLTLHWLLVGSRFDRGVLVIGQAVYGWYGDWTASEAADVDKRRAVIEDARDLFADRPDRMDWIEWHRVWNVVGRERTGSSVCIPAERPDAAGVRGDMRS